MVLCLPKITFDVILPVSSRLSIGQKESKATWPYLGNANLVPVVANGEVFVASGQELTIFGLSGNTVTSENLLVRK
ncbi:MAG TPA: hypothetical protein VMB18_17780 [Terriglobales bacterium]|nr:hypothetical protein [Terriglobales bacterium]